MLLGEAGTPLPCVHPLKPGYSPRPSPGDAAAPRRSSLPAALQRLCAPPGGTVPGAGRGAGVRGEPRQGFLPPRGRPSDQVQFAAGIEGLGRLPRARIALPATPLRLTLSPPDPSVALSGVAGTRGQAPRRREEASPVGRGGAGRGYLRRPAREGGRGSDYPREQRRLGKPPPPNPRSNPRPGPELELVLDTLSGRWRGNASGLGPGSCAQLPSVEGRARPPPRTKGSSASPGPQSAPNCLGVRGGPRVPLESPLRQGLRGLQE
jgi:hypothetical protein